MAGIFDTHTHFNDEIYKNNDIEISEIIKEANNNGVSNFCCVGFDVESSRQAVRYALKYPSVYGAVGIHPNNVNEFELSDLEEIDTLSYGQNVVAIGEIGLDYYYTPHDKDRQKTFFKKQIDIAIKNNLAVMMHIRDKDGSNQAYLDALEILKEKKPKRAIVHCYTRGYELAKKFIDLGCYLSIPGVVTFKNAKELQETVLKVSLNNILVETDAPYLTPEPNRGSINFSRYIVYTIKAIANIKQLNKNDVIEATSNNAYKVFKINH
ncbi:TatD family hydrolase [Spiroplasma turonicum]|uniref:Mg-dependent DNase n=1 Tax=Spiroplasma turonicum TaxID=216946 RepID=A0A0K1P7Z7_9MOLU|nr:TatD family hydrolase [Spiroplasma turonicum]AKU80329.1 Mg-dependent DNase [Spiroplasma turonicum]ALX71330.1 Mg-dependent DNase [Spiroplasma turonicum]